MNFKKKHTSLDASDDVEYLSILDKLAGTDLLVVLDAWWMLLLRACASSIDNRVGKGEMGVAVETLGGLLSDVRNLLWRGLCEAVEKNYKELG